MQNIIEEDDYLTVRSLKQSMDSAGYTEIAASISITLGKKGMLTMEKIEIHDEYNNNSYMESVCKLTEAGTQWVLKNQD